MFGGRGSEISYGGFVIGVGHRAVGSRLHDCMYCMKLFLTGLVWMNACVATNRARMSKIIFNHPGLGLHLICTSCVMLLTDQSSLI